MSRDVLMVIVNNDNQYVTSIQNSEYDYGTYVIADHECMLVMILPFYTPMSVVKQRLLMRGMVEVVHINLEDYVGTYPMYVTDETLLFPIDDRVVWFRVINGSKLVFDMIGINGIEEKEMTLACNPKHLFQAVKLLYQSNNPLRLCTHIKQFGIMNNSVCYVDLVV